MKILTVFFTVSLLTIMTCSVKPSMFQYNIYQTNIDIRHELFTHLLSDNKNYYLFGKIEKDIMDYRTSEIIIERADVGDEKKWTSFSEKISGKCQAVCQTDKFIYLISRQQFQEPQDPKYSKHILYEVSKENGEILKLHQWEKGEITLGGLTFLDDENGYMVMVSFDNKIRELIHTSDGGRNWSVFESGKKIGKFVYNDGIVYSLASKRNVLNWIFSIDKENGELDSLRFDLDITDFAVEKYGDYWLLGQDGDRTILQHYENGKVTEIKTFSEDANFFPTQLYKYNDVIVVLASKIDKSMLGGFGGTRPEMYFSKDNGLTWVKQSLGRILYLDPVSFYKDERMTAYTGNGNVLTISFKY